ncbi:hypothetical protein EFN20_05370 [Propionibacterium freudenreichii]|mgnify:CR=1 FL=1|uniref:Uncharacterized protein n=2 Tax=Propionibacterium freudenreichii TaxID=1744 RepID=D7GCC3_PROFC|nr:hypothetical protein [Propionibacterium freudenreichii]CEP26944.1 Hypothetical protein PFCIRM138_11050 [Propionibacterium freudenreichii subsp. freudenreichii]MCQ1996938.1 hypothetical protein [Propionibacterium freudenreichii]MCT2999462.1 hypothetical protein [Propionibacterium freudenreichii]MCT3005353.1 hypothetical protein [Propionibacterium freudenreichii]MCT3009301.1 hypothetical protein [Propionibacterium freudenreichii]
MRDEWLRQFRATQGRDPSPEEFLTAQQAGFPVRTPVQPQTPAQSQTPDTRWLAAFRASQGRLPSTQEFAAARAAGFPVGSAEPTTPGRPPMGDEPTQIIPPAPGTAWSAQGFQPTRPVQPVRPIAVPPTQWPGQPVPPVAAPPGGDGRTPLYRRPWALVVYVVVVALIAAGICFGIPGTGIHGLLNAPAATPSPSAGAASPSARSSASASPSRSASSASPSATPDGGTVVQSIQGVLDQATADRTGLAGAINSCDVAALGTITDNRAREIDALRSVEATRIPNGQQLVTDLITALASSQSADQQYLSWAQGGCQGTYPDFPSNADATARKNDFARVWNSSIVGTYSQARQVDPNEF